MRKQYINASNRGPSMALGIPWLLALTVYVLDWPEWVYGFAICLAIILVVSFIVRLSTEDGVDVVKRD